MLSLAELEVIRAAMNGETADCRAVGDNDRNPANAHKWGPNRVVRAEVIRWLCVDREARALVDPKGIQITFARIKNELNLSWVDIPFPIALHHCAIGEEIYMYDADVPMLSFQGSHTKSIKADGIHVRGDVFLREGFSAEGEVRFIGASIGGNLDCASGSFRNPKSKDDANASALSADRIDVKGSVFLRDGFSAEGEVRFLGATVGGNLDCRGGSFRNPKSKDDANARALTADEIDVKGSVVLDGDPKDPKKGFAAEGQVRFRVATIGGNLDCTGGCFRNLNCKDNAQAKALSAYAIDVKGSVFLRRDFAAEGEVGFSGATIGGDLDCTGGSFRNPKSKDDANARALTADRIDVKGSVFLRDGFSAEGEVRFSAEGEVRFVGASIGGDLICTGGTFTNPKSKDDANASALSADQIDVKRSVYLRDGFYAQGQVRFPGATIRRDLDCHNAKFNNPSDHALWLEGAKIGWRLIVGDRFRAYGKLSLAGASVGQLCDDIDSWPDEDNLRIHGFVYNTIHPLSPGTAQERLKWIRLQDPKRYSFQPYEQLAKALRESGNARGAREVLIAKEADLRTYGKLTAFRKAWNWFLEWTIAYGYETYRVLWGAMVFLALGAILFWRGKAKGLMVSVKGSPATARGEPASNPATQTRPKPAGEQTLSPLVYSLDALVPVVKLHQEEYWLPNPAMRWGWWLRVYLWVHIAMGWILTTLAVMGLTGIVRK